MELSEYERITPHMNHEEICFLTPNMQCAWRVETLLTKEPDTIAWLASMKPGETLYDVGANMGQYSLIAWKHGLIVHAFEPEAQNFALLCRNVAVNKASDRVTPWPMALSDKSGFDTLHLSNMGAGGSCHAYGESLNYHGQPKVFPYQQGSCAVTMDEFARKYGPPDHVKIDVDGFEHLVLDGATVCLNRAKSVLVELNRNYPEHLQVIKKMTLIGFTYDQSVADSALRKEGPFKDVGNIIFHRTQS